MVDPRSNGPELLVSVGLLLVIAAILFVVFQWIRFQFARRKHKALRRAQKAADDQRQRSEALEESSRVPESSYVDPESIAEASGAGHLDPASKSDVSGSDAFSTKGGAIGSDLVRWLWRPWLLWISVPLILLVLLVLTAIVPRYTMGKVSYCGTCHAMQVAVKSWRASNHSKVACQKCHEPPGISGFIISQAQGFSNISLSSLYWRRHRPIALMIPVSPGCLSCHEKIAKKIVMYNDSIKVSHKEFIYSVPCEDCHPASGHIGKKLKTSMMDKCVKCHEEKGASVACSVCHEEEPVWSKERLKGYAKARIKFSTSCKRCHESEMRCEQCHERPKKQVDD